MVSKYIIKVYRLIKYFKVVQTFESNDSQKQYSLSKRYFDIVISMTTHTVETQELGVIEFISI